MPRPNLNHLKILDLHDVRDINQTRFLHLIRERQPISRADLAKATKLRPGSVSAIVNRLIAEGLVKEGPEGPSTGGRRPRSLNVNSESAYVIALDIGVTESIIAVGDFNGRLLFQHAIKTYGKPATFVRSLVEKVHEFIRAHCPRARFEAVGVSIPGLVDRAEGRLVTSANLNWDDVPIRKLLEEQLRLPVYIENDANAAAFAELWYGPLEEASVRTLLFVLVVEGLGTGLIINGELHLGSRIGLGGFGHMTIDPQGPLCTCGRRGCWEAMASNRATLERYYRLAGKKGKNVLSVSELIERGRHFDQVALQALQDTAQYLAEGVANLAHGLSPETVIIGGEITGAWSLLEPVLKERIRSTYLIPGISVPRLRPASVLKPSLYGAITIALQHYFRPHREPLVSGGMWSRRA